MQGYSPGHLPEPAPDCVVVGNALSRGNAEVEETLNRRLVYRSQAEVVKEEFIRGRRSLVVAGTHGKTTTTSIATWVMERGGLNPSFLVGGVVQNFGASFRVTESPYFVIEGDEYDTAYFDKGPKFMHYLPETAIVGNIEFDHADIYQDLDAIKLAFRRLMNLVPSNGRLVLGWDSAVVREVVAEMGARLHTRLETFGTRASARAGQAHPAPCAGSEAPAPVVAGQRRNRRSAGGDHHRRRAVHAAPPYELPGRRRHDPEADEAPPLPRPGGGDRAAAEGEKA
jgi:UDP-N-acetylmuramate:L-alanyl-gamma-D-glutamyl-meso-diaminopimelate ligase